MPQATTPALQYAFWPFSVMAGLKTPSTAWLLPNTTPGTVEGASGPKEWGFQD